MNDWDKLYGAAVEVQKRKVCFFFHRSRKRGRSPLDWAGTYLQGRLHRYRPVLLACAAERNAIANMITNGEDEIDKILIIMPDGRPGLPCGAAWNL